ncbi:hypothetical protein CAPSP0001_0222 [Capnocytophaga sputigena ATCC 33612]|nr:hypothetical protein CAPSP0001_0222 [Capnocytophaga sputigena ATCC 33612]
MRVYQFRHSGLLFKSGAKVHKFFEYAKKSLTFLLNIF